MTRWSSSSPLCRQCGRFEFGLSYQSKQPVAKMIGERFPATMELAFCSALFALLVGIPMGVYTG